MTTSPTRARRLGRSWCACAPPTSTSPTRCCAGASTRSGRRCRSPRASSCAARSLAVGEGVTGIETGARVIAPAVLPDGAFAEQAVVQAATVLPAPAALDDAEAAALHIGYQTGWFGLHRRAALKAGETLLVHAAAGGVGSAAVQLGKAAGRHRDRSGRRTREGRGGPEAGLRRGRGPAQRGLRRGGQGGHRRTRRRRGLRPGRRRRVHQVHQVRRLRGPHRGRRLRQRHHPRPGAQPRPGEELLDPRACTGACTTPTTRPRSATATTS